MSGCRVASRRFLWPNFGSCCRTVTAAPSSPDPWRPTHARSGSCWHWATCRRAPHITGELTTQGGQKVVTLYLGLWATWWSFVFNLTFCFGNHFCEIDANVTKSFCTLLHPHHYSHYEIVNTFSQQNPKKEVRWPTAAPVRPGRQTRRRGAPWSCCRTKPWTKTGKRMNTDGHTVRGNTQWRRSAQ